MKSIKLFNYRAGYMVAAAAVLLATFLPAFASADQVTSRSIQLSNSSNQTSGVDYTVNFTPITTAGAVVVDFCSDSPIVGDTCTAPAGFSASSAATSGGFTMGTLTTTAANKLLVTGTMTAATPVSIALTNITNPDAAGALYARIITYVDSTAAAGYTSATPGTYIDQGGVALSITPSVAVSGAVLESMTFCVSGTAITASCAATTTPVLRLGKDLGSGVKALDSSEISTGNVYTQITTNAVSGATVYLKSNAANCGGLVNSSNPTNCDIKPATGTVLPTTDFAAGTALFGVKTAASTPTASLPAGVTATGILQPVGLYDSPYYFLGYTAGGATGITSTFGDEFLNTNNAPVNNQNMTLTFGASVTGNTPAGNYSANLSMIATGKY